jgi:hypothetical protein
MNGRDTSVAFGGYAMAVSSFRESKKVRFFRGFVAISCIERNRGYSFLAMTSVDAENAPATLSTSSQDIAFSCLLAIFSWNKTGQTGVHDVIQSNIRRDAFADFP